MTGQQAQAQRLEAVSLVGQAGPVGGTVGDEMTVIVGLLLPAVQFAGQSKGLCNAGVRIDILDARNLGQPPLATTGNVPAATADTISLNFAEFVSPKGPRLDVIARVTVTPAPSTNVSIGAWAAICRQAASVQFVDTGTGRPFYIDDIIIGFVGQDPGG
jgi:hypothetical protein